MFALFMLLLLMSVGETMSLNCGQRAYCSSPRWYMSMESHGRIILTGLNWITRRKTSPSATLPIINPTWTEQSANPGLRGKRPVTNRLRYGTVCNACNSVQYNLDYPRQCGPRPPRIIWKGRLAFINYYKLFILNFHKKIDSVLFNCSSSLLCCYVP
jgi:hypothetical protein